MIQNVIKIKGGIIINVSASAKNIIHVKKIILGVLLNVVVTMKNT